MPRSVTTIVADGLIGLLLGNKFDRYTRKLAEVPNLYPKMRVRNCGLVWSDTKANPLMLFRWVRELDTRHTEAHSAFLNDQDGAFNLTARSIRHRQLPVCAAIRRQALPNNCDIAIRPKSAHDRCERLSSLNNTSSQIRVPQS